MPRRTVAHTVVLALLSGLYPVAAQAGEGRRVGAAIH